jgi:dipeptidyl aminopeptidase/acylaminoacyl peptidase
MAKDTLQSRSGPTNPEGTNDNSPAEELPSWYQTQGVHSHSQHFVERKTGNLLINKFSAPVLNIHGDLRDRVFIETTEALYMFIKIDDPIPT